MKKLFKKGAAILGAIMLLANVILPGVVAYAENEEQPVSETPTEEAVETPDTPEAPADATSGEQQPTDETPANSGEGNDTDAPVAPVEGQQVIEKTTDSMSTFDGESNYVAQVGETNYESLQAAVDAAEDGDTVTVLDDLNQTTQVNITKSITLDLNGKTLSNTNNIWSDSAWSLISAQGDIEVIITGNGTLNAKEDDEYAVDLRDGAKVTIENGTYNGNIHAVYIYQGELIIKGGTYKIQQLYPDVSKQYEFTINLYDANRTAGTAKAVIKGGTFYKFNPADNKAEGVGTNFVAEGYQSVADGDNYTVSAIDYTVTISDSISNGTVTANKTTANIGDEITLTATPNDGYKLEMLTVKSGETDIAVDNNKFIMPAGDIDIDAVFSAIVARIGETSCNQEGAKCYTSLQAAVDAAEDGDTVTVLDDLNQTTQVNITKSITLDLNGKTLSNTNNIWSDSAWSLISAQGDIEVIITGNGTLNAKEDDEYAVDLRDGAKVTIENGTYNGNIHAVYIYQGELIIKGGTYKIQQLYPDVSKQYEFTINLYDANRTAGTAKAVIKGGTFYKFNPADNKAEGVGTNFVAEGYKSTADGDNYTVTIQEYTITYELSGGVLSGDDINPEAYTIESDVITLNNPIRTGYTFTGWSGTDIEGISGLVTIAKGSTGNRNYEANWEINQYTITFDTDGGSAIATITGDYGQIVPSVANPTKECNSFAGWDKELPTTMPAENITLKATWNYTCSRSSGGGGGSSRSSSNNTMNEVVLGGEVEVATGDNAEVNTGDENKLDENNDDNNGNGNAEANDSELVAAYEWAYKNGITTMPTIEEARLKDGITRAELAKMMVVFMSEVLHKQPVITETFDYQDVNEKALGDLTGYIQLAYQYQIMGINADGKALQNFNPRGKVSRAEFATVLSRVLYGNKYNQSGANYYELHIQALSDAKILKDTNPKIQELRGWIILMLYRSQNSETNNVEENTAQVTTGDVAEVESGSAVEVATGTTAEIATGEVAQVTTGDVAEVESGSAAEVTTGTTAEIDTGAVVEAATGATAETAITEANTGDVAKVESGSTAEVATGDSK